jgi:hypothetical protein
MTSNSDKVKIQFENPSFGDLVTVTLAEILNSGVPINEDGIKMEFVEAWVE